MRNFAVVAALTVALASACAPSPVPPTSAPPGSPTPAMELAEAALPTSPLPAGTAGRVPDATQFPDPGVYTWAVVATGFESPVDVQFPPDGSGRLFVVEQPGRIRMAQDMSPAPEPFLDITDRVESRGNEQGLLGLAFHPQFADNGRFFVNYTDRAGHNVIARFEAPAGADAADPASEAILVSVDDPFGNHNGGVLAFGPDAFLYAGMGDGGSANDSLGNAQNTYSMLGKILRLDVDGAQPYSIPSDNPFAQAGGRPEVWAYGLRNPWRMSFDAATGDLYIGDVGQGNWEEVDYLPSGSPGGANFGWNLREGAHAFAGNPEPGAQLIDPVAEYDHSQADCSITGGYVYRGGMSEWNGIYLYGDYCSGTVRGLLRSPAPDVSGGWVSGPLFETGARITTFGQDQSGEIYLADRQGDVFRLQAASQ